MKNQTDTVAEPSSPDARNARGEWWPSYPCAYAPLFVWPPRPRAFLRWLVNWPGFVWPVNLGLLLVSVVSWFYLQPDLARCAKFRWDWIAQIWLRNLGLIWLVYGGLYLLMYILKVDGMEKKYAAQWPARNSARFLFNDQVYDNIFWTCGVAGAIWTTYEAVTLWLYANHRIPYLDWHEHPAYFILWIVLIPFCREFHFYWTHRLIHWKPLYKRVHYLHHKNVDVNPWSGLAMHPVETILYFAAVLIHWVIPSHPLHALFNLQHAALGPAFGHLGFESPILSQKLPVGSYFHYLHHRYFECNYGEATLPLDRWFGTFRDGLPDGEGCNLMGEHKIQRSPRSEST